jgi:hypothetical protein
VFSYTGYNSRAEKFLFECWLKKEKVTIKLQHSVKELQGVTVTDQKDRRQSWSYKY